MSHSDVYSRVLYAVQALRAHADSIEQCLFQLYDPACPLEQKRVIVQVFRQQGPSMQRALDSFMTHLPALEREVLR